MPEKTVRINSGNTLGAFLQSVIDEEVNSRAALSRKALDEKEKQAAATKDTGEEEDVSTDDLFGGLDTGAGESEPEPADTSATEKEPEADAESKTSKTFDDEFQKLKKGNVSVSDVVEKLNSIRSGKSFKDSAISKAMDQYVNSLKKPERVALLAFLKGIAQIVTGEISGEQAQEPSKRPADVEMKKDQEPGVKHMKPNVIKAPITPKKPSTENTSAPLPITPKKK